MNWACERSLQNMELCVQDIHALHVFPVPYGILELQGYALNLFFLQTADALEFPVHLANLINALSSPRSPLQMLYIDMLLETWESNDWKKEMASFPPAMLADILDAGWERGWYLVLGSC
jgi:hypothetical protein